MMWWFGLALITLGVLGLLGWIAHGFNNTPLALVQATMIVAGIALLMAAGKEAS